MSPRKAAGASRAKVFATIARELQTIAKPFAAGDHERGDELLEPWLTETLCERLEGEWSAFENVVLEVQAKLDPFNVGAMKDGVVDNVKFARHVVKYAAKWRERAEKAAAAKRQK